MTTEERTRVEGRRDWLDLFWTAVLIPEEDYAHVRARFALYKHEGQSMEDRPLFWRRDSTSNMDATEDPHESEPTGEMYVKWDGCGDISIEGLHVCEFEHVQNLGTALTRVYEWARELGMDRC